MNRTFHISTEILGRIFEDKTNEGRIFKGGKGYALIENIIGE